MKLAYQDMSLQRKKQEEKIKATDPKKAEQLERLGMGFISNKSVPFCRSLSLSSSLSHTHASRPLLFHLGISGSGTVSHISVISSPAEFYFERGVVLGEGFVYMKIRMKGLERGVSKRADP